MPSTNDPKKDPVASFLFDTAKLTLSASLNSKGTAAMVQFILSRVVYAFQISLSKRSNG
jgi:hypothetical protein